MSTHDLKIISVPFHIDDVSTAGQVHIPVNAEMEGDIIEIRTVLDAAIGTANAVLTTKINGTTVTGSAVTITQSGSATRDVDSAAPTGANAVVEGDVIEVETNGASSNTVKVFGMIMINRGGH